MSFGKHFDAPNHLIGKSTKRRARHDNQIMAQNGIKTHKNDISQMEHVLDSAKINDAKSFHINKI